MCILLLILIGVGIRHFVIPSVFLSLSKWRNMFKLKGRKSLKIVSLSDVGNREMGENGRELRITT